MAIEKKKKYFLLPVKKIPSKPRKSVLYNNILDEFIKSGLRCAEVTEVGRKPRTIQIMLKKKLKERLTENIKVRLRNKKVYLERLE